MQPEKVTDYINKCEILFEAIAKTIKKTTVKYSLNQDVAITVLCKLLAKMIVLDDTTKSYQSIEADIMEIVKRELGCTIEKHKKIKGEKK